MLLGWETQCETLSNIDREAERDVESASRTAKESYSQACESVLGKKRKELRTE